MAIKMISREWCCVRNEYVQSYILDSASDVESLPACTPGSTAIVADTDGPVYMVNASGEWKEL